MKIKARQYASALYGALKDKDKAEAKEAIRNFIYVLAADNKLSQANNIIDEFINIYNKQEGIVDVELNCANELNKSETKAVADRVKELTHAAKVNITQVVNKKLLGGIIIRFEDQILDGCVQTRLQDLKNVLIK